jgi:hypothetical protein
MNPIWPHVDYLSIRELLLVKSTTDTVTAFNYGHHETMAEENVGTAQAGQAGADNGNVRF